MNFPSGLLLFGVAFFGLMAVVNAVQAYRKKEKLYYLAAVVGFMALLAFVLASLNQLVLVLILVIAASILSVAGLPKMLKIQEREMIRKLQKADLSEPLRVIDFFTNTGWFKLASTWGLWKTMFLFYLLSVLIIGGIFFILNMFYSFITTGLGVGYTAAASIFVAFIFYRQMKKALEME